MQRRWLGVLAAASLLCACTQAVDGSPVAGVPGVATQFDPCSIPDDAIAATGLDPATKKSGWSDGVTKREWKRCVWQGPEDNPWYFFEVLFSQEFSERDLRENRELSDLSDVELGGRRAVAYQFTRTDPTEGCGAGFDTAEGVAMFSVDLQGGMAPRGDPCKLVLLHTADVATFFPPAR